VSDIQKRPIKKDTPIDILAVFVRSGQLESRFHLLHRRVMEGVIVSRGQRV
jgi:hypothetical protein